MSDRFCMKCGYTLSGLPAEGTVVTCPECAHANDLAVPLPEPTCRFAPVLWGMAPAALGVFGIICLGAFGDASDRSMVTFLVLGVLGGAITAGLLTHLRLGQAPAMGRTPRPPLTRLALSICAAAASVVCNAMALFLVWLALFLIVTI